MAMHISHHDKPKTSQELIRRCSNLHMKNKRVTHNRPRSSATIYDNKEQLAPSITSFTLPSKKPSSTRRLDNDRIVEQDKSQREELAKNKSCLVINSIQPIKRALRLIEVHKGRKRKKCIRIEIKKLPLMG